MITLGDRLTTLLARELTVAADVRIVAMTTLSSLVAVNAANHLGADLALATGFGTVDAPAEPTAMVGDWGLRTADSPVGPLSDTFMALARGIIGVATSPAQLDARGAANLSFVGGDHGAPKVALPGSRGLPENHDSPSQVWYVFGSHSARTLVPEVDFVSGPPPAGDQRRRMLSPLGLFEVTASGWTTVGLWPDVEPDTVAESTGFDLPVPADVPRIPEPGADELAALDAVDPMRYRDIEFLAKDEAGAKLAEVAAAELARWQAR